VDPETIERLQCERVQHGEESRLGIVRQRLPQRQGTVGGEFGQQPLGQGLDAVVLLRLRVTTDGDDGPLDHRVDQTGTGNGGRGTAATLERDLRFRRGFVLRPHVAPLDAKRARPVQADESARPGDLGRVVAHRSVLEGFQRRLDLAQTGIDLIGHVAVGLVPCAQAVHLLPERVAGGLLFNGQHRGLAADASQAVAVAVGEVRV